MQRNNHSTFKSLCLLVAGVLVAGASLVAVLEVRAGVTTDSVGPDVTIYDLTGTNRYGPVGDFVAYSVGTNSCNVGTVPLNWCDDGGESGCGGGTTFRDHPVIAQNLYRLKNDRFQQLGMSWLKHGFLSTNSPVGNGCLGNGGTQQCTNPPLGSDQLGIGCTDIYGPGLNGSQGNGPRSEVNATTGDFPMPHGSASGSGSLYSRIIVPVADMDPAQNAGAHYWVEGQYVAPDDAKAANGFNNASYRKVSVGTHPFSLSFIGGTERENTAIEGWAAFDAAVELVHVDFTESDPTIPERFTVARKVVDLGGGDYRYEYAIHNMNSLTGARGFSIQFPANVTITNVGFYDVDHHSGEPYSNTDWVSTVTADAVEWTTDPGDTGPNANALRWATMYSFWFEANADSTGLLHSIDVDGNVAFDFNGIVDEIFTDGFESGDTTAWSSSAP